jgi:hypothetical protein
MAEARRWIQGATQLIDHGGFLDETKGTNWDLIVKIVGLIALMAFRADTSATPASNQTEQPGSAGFAAEQYWSKARKALPLVETSAALSEQVGLLHASRQHVVTKDEVLTRESRVIRQYLPAFQWGKEVPADSESLACMNAELRIRLNEPKRSRFAASGRYVNPCFPSRRRYSQL